MTKNHVKIIIASVVLILFLIIGLQNTASVETRLLFATIEMPRVVLLLVTFALGGIVGFIGGLYGPRPKPRGPKP
jgi:uncharacterized integral membrane protein